MAYILLLRDESYALLDKRATLSEPVPKTAKSGRETVLIRHGEEFTHVATGTTQKGRMTLTDIRRLSRPLQWLEMPLIIPARLRAHARRIFTIGGRLPPKTGRAIIAALEHLMPELRA